MTEEKYYFTDISDQYDVLRLGLNLDIPLH